MRRDISYQVIGGTKFYERAEIKDAIAYLTVLGNPQDVVSFSGSSTRRGAGSARPRSGARSRTPTRPGSRSGRRRRTPTPCPASAPRPCVALGRFMDTMTCCASASSSVYRSATCSSRCCTTRVHRRAEGRAHDRGAGARGEPRRARRGRAPSSTPAPRRTRTRSMSSCRVSRSSPTPTRAPTTRVSSR